MGLNLTSLVLSVAAVAVSSWGIRLQVSRARAASDLAITTDLLLTHVRDPKFQWDRRWVLNDLAQEHGPENGIEGLPDPANYRVWNMGFVCEAISITLRCDMANPVILLEAAAKHRRGHLFSKRDLRAYNSRWISSVCQMPEGRTPASDSAHVRMP
ncbi:hypothetical protein [Streptomyces sp. NBC_01304]|uniref:hypothetical protein n=1 Tax=Streptomyces sp. NBC_01304 TaxID=2903818 RepID=UPI002E0F1276|nr:hypothetical protein OG430_01615 [Streptomyces sp. NBC_01304]